MTRLCYIYFTLLFAFICHSGWGQYYTFKRYNHRNNLNTESTLCTAQDSKGYIWIGTDGGGLMRFDGFNFKEIGKYSSANTLHVSAIAPEANGTIYFATKFDGIYSLSGGKYTFIYNPAVETGDIRTLNLIESNLIYAADYRIDLITRKGKLIDEVKIKNGPINVFQTIKLANAVIILSDKGNFAVLKDKILPLQKWLKDYFLPSEIDFATYDKNRLTLYHDHGKKFTEISFSTFGTAIKSKVGTVDFKLPKDKKTLRVAENQGNAYLFFGNNLLYKFSRNKCSKITINSDLSIANVNGMMLDNLGDLWINNDNGVFKVSQEPFTRILFHQGIDNRAISFYHHIESADLDLVGTSTSKFLICNFDQQKVLNSYSLILHGISETPFGTYLAASSGIYQLKGTTVTKSNFPVLGSDSYTMIFFDGECFWYAETGRGITRYNPKTKQLKTFADLNVEFPHYFYSAQLDFTGKNIYFGTNNGIWKFNKKKNQFSIIQSFKKYGSYAGNAVKDKYGTLWFTLDEALVGITKTEEYVVISDKKKLPSTLFYTLNSDQYGNLLVGTNKGINVIKIDNEGNVLSHRNFSHFEGFGGYETNMRASYQNNNLIFVGTIEGLFQINSYILENYPTPPTPEIKRMEKSSFDPEYDAVGQPAYYFTCILPKSTGISYSYRIMGYSDHWSNLTKNNYLNLPDMENGDYILEVRATYDGINFSPSGKLLVTIDKPLYKNKWFLIFIVVLLGILNIAFLEWSKTYVSTKMADTNVLAIDIQLIPKLLIFSILVILGLPFLVNNVQEEFKIGMLSTLIQTVVLALLYILTRVALSKNKWTYLIAGAAYMAYATIAVGSYVLIYQTRIHPYPVLELCILTSVLPFLISKIRLVTLICIGQILLSFVFIIILNHTVYNEVLFLVAVTVSSALVVIFSYVRLDSLEKLVFVNGIINRGNVISISFDQNGIITYCSKNINHYFKFESALITGKSTSIFNEVVLDQDLRKSKITELFEDGKTINIPMIDKHGKMIWIEWICKEISENVRVIMGQDVTEKLMISNNYQSLVENAKDLIFNTDINGNFLFVNEYTKKMLGYREESLIGKNSISLVVPEYQQYVTDFYTNQFDGNIKNTYLEYPIRNKEGKVFWLGQNLTLVYEPGSRVKISGFIVLARDITERRANDLLLEQQNKEISSGIDSAKRIQFNLLPDQGAFSDYFGDTFVFFKPKDIVSGDFYWIRKVENKVIVALADCTGHGISGAFLTILGFNLMNQIVLERKVCESDKIIEQMGLSVADALKEEPNTLLNNEMDLLVMVFEGDQVNFSSTGVGLIVHSDNELKQYKNTFSEDHTSTQKITLKVNENDSFYLLTDGYLKQFGALAGKKFGSKRILELIEKIHPETMSLQKKYLENTLRNWSEGHEQTDDITVIGLKNFKH